MKNTISDYHVHTHFSTDSEAPMEDMVKTAIAKGMNSICFTDHIDYGFPEHLDTFLFDIPSYLKEIARLRTLYGNKLFIYQGVEMGIKNDVYEECDHLAKSFPFDFIIGSTHLVDNEDPYYPDIWNSMDEKKCILRFFECTLENVRMNLDYDVYGHLDYIIRYAPSVLPYRKNGQAVPSKLCDVMKDYGDIIDAILRELIKQGKGLECNTAGFHYGVGHPNPNEAILKHYRSLGGEILTIGSDAHQPEHLGYEFLKLPALLSSLGFNYYTTFQKRKPVFHPLASV